MQQDAAWAPLVLAPVEVLGVESLADGLATIRTRFKTVPLRQRQVANELRRRVMGAFVGRGIRPYADYK
jgi:small conductance mechanosensitive channel